MKPPAFKYERPTDLSQALDFLEQHGDDAKVLAGGQSLVPMMNMRLASPAVLVDINRVSGLAGLEKHDGSLRVGGMARHRELELSDAVMTANPVLVEAAKNISHVTIRNRGTIGGSLAHCDPSAEWATVGLAVGMEVVLRSAEAERKIPLSELLLGPFYTSIKPTELLTQVVIPNPGDRTGAAFLEIQRNHGNFAVASACALLSTDSNGRIDKAEISLGGVSSIPIAVPEISQQLVGHEPSEAAFREAGDAIRDYIDPATDVQATAEYRTQVAAVLVRRALISAASRVKGDDT